MSETVNQPEASATEFDLHLQKALRLLAVAQALVRDGYHNDAARNAYLATYHATQAYIVQHAGKAVKTHDGAHSQFVQLVELEPRFTEDMKTLLARICSLKTIAYDEFGEGAGIPPERAVDAVLKAGALVQLIESLLATSD